MGSKKAKEPRKEKLSATIIPFPELAPREVDAAAKDPFLVIPRRASIDVSSKEAPKPANKDDRPTLPSPKYAPWWETAILASLLIHGLAVLAFSLKYSYDLERAAGAASASTAEGALVIPIEVIVNAALPSAPTPTDVNAPDEKKAAKTTPKDEMKTKEKTEAGSPQKNDEVQEVVPTAKETPTPAKRERKQKKETAQQSRSTVASTNAVAASPSEGRAGAGGHVEFGGTADISSYQAQVLAHLQHYRVYPPEAKSAGIHGTTVIRFALDPQGSVISASLAGGSGASILDQAALSMVHRASPFPPFPPGLRRSRIDFAAPVRFDLR
jgi:periplasmic protein TonB